MKIFNNFNKEIAKKIDKKYNTPIFIFDEEGIKARYQEFSHAVNNIYNNFKIAISYKTNPLIHIISLLDKMGAYPEVVSGIEYQLARKVTKKQIVFNGPLKTKEELLIAIQENSIINCDHLHEVKLIATIANKLKKQVKIGLRICFIGNGNWNRFGFEYNINKNITKELESAINLIKQKKYLKLGGLHAHIGTNIRDLELFAILGKNMAQLALELKNKYDINLDWIDFGGGVAGINPTKIENKILEHPLPCLKQYAKLIITPLLPYLESNNNKSIAVKEMCLMS